MTTFQDPQPQSRRAVRQGERGESADQGQSTEFPAQPPTGPQYFSDPDIQRDMWDTNARRAAQLPATAAPRAGNAVTGRRAAANPSQPPAAAEPLNYSTASRPAAPSNEPQFRSRLEARQAPQDAAAPQAAAAPPAAAAPQTRTDDQSFRVRDFSPEGRRATQAAERAAAAPPWTPASPPTDLDYQTEVRGGFGTSTPAAPISQVPPQYAAPVAPPAATPPAPRPLAPPNSLVAPTAAPVAAQPVAAPIAPAAAPPPAADAPSEQTLSRRELRALLAEQDSAASVLRVPLSEAATHNAPIAWPAAVAAAVAPPATDAPPALAPLVAPAAPQPALLQPAVQQPAVLPPLQAERPYEATRFPDVLPELEEPADQLRRVNHWSIQDEPEHHSVEGTISRRVSSGTTATNALVLPEVPLGSDIRGALTSTGEVMLTGSIDLPHSLSSTGTSDRIDHDGIDGLFDLHDHEVISTDSQPVRAIKAVSTHQTGHGVTHTQKPKGNRALTVLLIAASSMAVVVAGLLVAAFAFNLF